MKHVSMVLAVSLLLVAGGCEDVEQASTSTTPPAPKAVTLTLDTLTGSGLDVGGMWTGVTMLAAPDHSVHVVALDQYNGVLHYAGCANACDDPAHWFKGIGDAGEPSAFASASSALTPAGVQAVFAVWVGNSSGIRYAHCPGACNFTLNWVATNLFVGQGSIGGRAEIHSTPLASDPGGGLHLLFLDDQDGALYYATCASACDNQANWQQVRIDSTYARFPLPSARLITVAPGGGVHTIYAKDSVLVHTSCAAACTSAGNWRSEVLPGTAVSGWVEGLSVAFAPDGRLHLAYVDDGGHPTYATCAAPCTSPGGWSAVTLPVSAGDVSIATGPQGRLYLASAGATVALSRCDGGCTSAGSWQTTTADSMPDAAVAFGYGHVSVAVDSAGHALIASSYQAWPQVLRYSRMLQ